MSQFKSGRGRCPVNGSKRWSYLGPDHAPEFIISYGTPTHEPTQDWIYTGESDSGGMMFTLADDAGSSSSFNDTRKSELISLQPGQLDTISTQTQEATDPQLLHRVYEELLARCPLNASHRSHLVHRKIPYQELCCLLSFGSLPHPTKRPKLAKQICEALELSLEDLLKVAGFFINDNSNLSIAGSTGLLVPAYDTKGRIQGLQIRKDGINIKKDQSRYTWMSSASKGGKGSGAPGCFLGDRHGKTIWFTEGTIKGAALVSHSWATSVITVPGVGNISSAMALFAQLENAEKAVIAYDIDWREKPGVLKGLARLIEALTAKGIPVQSIAWDPVWGKGIDDAITKGLPQTQLFTLPNEGIIRAATSVKYANPRLHSEKQIPVWKPSRQATPTIDELRTETTQAVFDALHKPAGTFSSVAANTGSGKTHAVIHKSPTQTIQMYRNYGALEEAEEELRQLHGQGMVRVLYGRIAPPTNPKDFKAHKRYERAGCPHHEEMKKRAERGHPPCLGCPLAPKRSGAKASDPEKNNENEEEQNTCAYWQQRFKTIEEQPAYLLAVPQSIAANPDLLSLLPKEETCELFGEYARLVIDDCPEFIQHLTRESSLSLSDVRQWLHHPGLQGQSQEPGEALETPADSNQESEKRLLKGWLQGLLSWFESGSQHPAALKALRESSQKVASLRTIICEEPTDRVDEKLPLKAVNSLASWLARGGAIRFEDEHQSSTSTVLSKPGKRAGEAKERRLFYLRPAKELLERLRLMTVCYLDATPDESILAWFANLAGMKFEAYEMKRRFPPIIQIPDILWDREQIKAKKDLVRALTEHIHDQGGIVLGFKNREGEEKEHLALDGHWGYSERGFNCFSGVPAMALIGHFSLPAKELNNIAWQMRELSKVMDKAFPDVFIQGVFDNKRTYSDPWRPFVREMHTCEDRLVEHMRRHRHTSAVLQGANRPRNFGAPVYLLSGEPLDGLPWDVPVEIWTQEELIQKLGLEVQRNQSAKKGLSVALKATNQERKEAAQARLDSLMPGARSYAQELGRLPGIRELRTFLAAGDGMVTQDLAYKVRDQLALERTLASKGIADSEKAAQKADHRFENEPGTKGEQGLLEGIELGVPHSHLNTLNSLSPGSGTPQSISKNALETSESKGKYDLCGQKELETRRGFPNLREATKRKPVKSTRIEARPTQTGLVVALVESSEANGGERQHRQSERPDEKWESLPSMSRYPLNRRDTKSLQRLSETAKKDVFCLYDEFIGRYGWKSIYQMVSQSFSLSVEAFCSFIWACYEGSEEYRQPFQFET